MKDINFNTSVLSNLFKLSGITTEIEIDKTRRIIHGYNMPTGGFAKVKEIITKSGFEVTVSVPASNIYRFISSKIKLTLKHYSEPLNCFDLTVEKFN